MTFIGFINILPQEDFYPLTHLRDIQDLVIGAFCYSERIELITQEKIKWLEDKNIPLDSTVTLFSSSIIPEFNTIKQILHTQQDTIWMNQKGDLIAVRISSLSDVSVLSDADKIKKIGLSQIIIEDSSLIANIKNLADILNIQTTILNQDIEYLIQQHHHQKPHSLLQELTVQGDPNLLYIHSSCVISPFVVFNTQKGAIYIEDNVEISPFSYIEGPCIVKSKTKVAQAVIRSCYIGKDCRVGGEVDSSILLPYVNKAHEGFLGHSYIGSFVNFGALATTSNLKNNYQSIVLNYLGKTINTHSIKIGSLIGDFTTLGIGSLLNTGTSIGVACNIVHQAGFPPKSIESFTWIDTNKKYDWVKLLQDIEYRMSRRNQALSDVLKDKLKYLYHQSI